MFNFIKKKNKNPKAAYEASKGSRTRRNIGDNSSADMLTYASSEILRGQARHLEQNLDLARGVLRELTNKTIGAKGIQVESLVRDKNGNIDADTAKLINEHWQKWCERCDVTGEFSYPQLQRLIVASKYRDGESFQRLVAGRITGLTHNTQVPFSVQAFEADFVPFIEEKEKRIFQGIQRDDWGRAANYAVLKQHPSESFSQTYSLIRSANICHAKNIERLGQSRGVSVFASVLNRFNDLKDYEDSEQVAARISASMAAYVKRGIGNEETGEEFTISGTKVYDGLAPGDEVGTIESNRPSQLLQGFRDSMLKAISTGTGAGYSPISNDYSGTYSSQRQQLVDNWINYEVLQNEIIASVIKPTFRAFVQMLQTSGMIKNSKVDITTIFDADYRGPVMPWIDPKKEADAHLIRLSAQLTSPQKVMRNTGENPQEVSDQIKAYLDMLNNHGLQPPEYLAQQKAEPTKTA